MVFHTYVCPTCTVGFDSEGRRPLSLPPLSWPRCSRCRRPAEVSAWSFLFAGLLLQVLVGLQLSVNSGRDSVLVAAPFYGLALVRFIRHGKASFPWPTQSA